AVVLQLPDEGLVADLEDLSGAAAVPARFFQRLLDLPSLHLVHHAARAPGPRPRHVDLRPGSFIALRERRRLRLAEREIEMARVDGVAFGQNHRPLDAVLQFPDVARPW